MAPLQEELQLIVFENDRFLIVFESDRFIQGKNDRF